MCEKILRFVKKSVKTGLDQKLSVGTLSIKNIKKGTKYVSFDIFDTLIVRDVNKPTDVFRLLEYSTKIENFAERRVIAEEKAREKSKNREVTLREIYQNFACISVEEINKLCRLELEMEISICHPSLEVLDFFNKCKKEYKVIIVSDMYLASDMMKKILDHCGITGYEGLYISCEIGKSKGNNGELYDHVIRRLGVKADEITHIGNDVSADIIQAGRKGLNVLKVKTNPKRLMSNVTCPKETSTRKDFQRSLLYYFINNTTPNLDFYYRFGYENLGVLLWGFNKWLFEKIKEDKIEQVLFIARDGHMIKKVYDAMGLSKKIPSYYFEMSRRSIRVPSSFSDELSYMEMLERMPLPSRASIEQIFDAWGLEMDLYTNVYTELGISKGEMFWVRNLKEEDKIKKLYLKLKKDIIENARREYKLLFEYIDQFRLDKRTALVDIGWGGTIQKELLRGLKKEGRKTSIHGYYIALDQRTKKDCTGINLNAKGYLWDNYNGSGDLMEEKTFVGLFETFFLENAGSIKKYVYVDGRIAVERYPYEYLIPGGKLDETGSVRRIQQGAEDFVENVEKCFVGRLGNICAENAFCFMRSCLTEPSEEIVKCFGEFRFFNSGEETYLASPKMGLFKYAMHPKRMIADFYESQWKIGFLKALFKVGISYEWMWRTLKLVFSCVLKKE